MVKTKNRLGMLAMALAFGFAAAGCSTSPPVRPALSQTVINIQRSSTNRDTGKLFIYVDDQIINKDIPIQKEQFATYVVHNGVHYIHGVCGRLVAAMNHPRPEGRGIKPHSE